MRPGLAATADRAADAVDATAIAGRKRRRRDSAAASEPAPLRPLDAPIDEVALLHSRGSGATASGAIATRRAAVTFGHGSPAVGAARGAAATPVDDAPVEPRHRRRRRGSNDGAAASAGELAVELRSGSGGLLHVTGNGGYKPSPIVMASQEPALPPRAMLPLIWRTRFSSPPAAAAGHAVFLGGDDNEDVDEEDEDVDDDLEMVQAAPWAIAPPAGQPEAAAARPPLALPTGDVDASFALSGRGGGESLGSQRSWEGSATPLRSPAVAAGLEPDDATKRALCGSAARRRLLVGVMAAMERGDMLALSPTAGISPATQHAPLAATISRFSVAAGGGGGGYLGGVGDGIGDGDVVMVGTGAAAGVEGVGLAVHDPACTCVDCVAQAAMRLPAHGWIGEAAGGDGGAAAAAVGVGIGDSDDDDL